MSLLIHFCVICVILTQVNLNATQVCKITLIYNFGRMLFVDKSCDFL